MRVPAQPGRCARPLVDLVAVVVLLRVLREASAHEQAAALADRPAAADMFRLFLKAERPVDQFRFGREVDGTPAAPWGWEEGGVPWMNRLQRKTGHTVHLSPLHRTDTIVRKGRIFTSIIERIHGTYTGDWVCSEQPR